MRSKRYSWFSEVDEVENHISVGFSRIVTSQKTIRRCCFAVDSENLEKVIEETACEENSNQGYNMAQFSQIAKLLDLIQQLQIHFYLLEN